MKTDDLVTLLAAGGGAAEPNAVARRYALALGWGAFGAVLLMAVLLGVRTDLLDAARQPMFWVKLAFPATLAAAALSAAVRLSRPGMPLRRAATALAAPFAAMGLLAMLAILQAPIAEREALIFGGTWRACLLAITVLSVPAFVAALWAMKGLAPTRPTLAGAASGLLAGALAALIYALHCTEMAAPFLALWYAGGMLIPAAAGALVGRWLLRW